MIKGLIFDVDGTLLDSMSIWESIGSRYLKMKGIEPEPDLDDKLFCMRLEEGAKYLEDNYPIDVSGDDIVAEFMQVLVDYYANEAPLKDDAVALLEAIKERGLPMIVVSSTNSEQLRDAFARLDLAKYFIDIISCADVKISKSDPRIFEMAARELGTLPQETAVIEDGLYAVRTAKSAGFRTVGIYDSVSEADQEDLKAECDLYLTRTEFDERILRLGD